LGKTVSFFRGKENILEKSMGKKMRRGEAKEKENSCSV